MATITTATYLDGGTAITAGEAWTINSGGSLTIRTDTRVHANAPASNTGSLGSNTINDGALYWDSTNVRWLKYNTGTGNVPAIGTTITQGAVSGYLLGVWASKTAAVTAVGAAMPTSGFIKLREVTGGTYSAGALTGIGASATGADVQGWISITHDAAADIVVPRLGKHQARGGRFFLETTTGARGQVFQVPSEGSTAMFAPGMWVETAPASDKYEFWPALGGATPANNGWAHQHVGNATGTTDIRQRYLKATAGGGMVMGETWSLSGTYVSLAAQASTYAEVSQACTYTWSNNIVECYIAVGHQLETGQQTGLDFTSGGATAYDGIYTVTVVDHCRFQVTLAGSGAGGNVTSRPGVTVTFTAHLQNIGDRVYCDFTSGTGVDGTYEIYMVGSANAYTIKYPHTTAITSGNVSVLHSLTITATAHGLAVGQTVYCDFTSGAGVDGVYVIKTVVDANNIRVNMPHSAAIASSNVTLKRDIGYVAPAGCRTWIGSNILNECATAARDTNTIPNATIASRPEWTTTSAGAIDLEYVYGCSGYLNLSQPYSVRLRNCVFPDASIISECATPLDIDGLYWGMCSGLDIITFTCNNNYAGGIVKNVKAHRGNPPGASDHAISINYCFGQTLENVEAAIIQYVRSTGYFYAANCNGLTFNNCRSLNTRVEASGSPNCTFNDYDHVERINGNGLAAFNAITLGVNCHNGVIDGVTHGFNGVIPNMHPYAYAYAIGCTGVKVRNIGSYNSPMPLPTWAPNISTPVYIFQSGGANNTVKVQRCFVRGVRTAQWVTTNSDKNMLYESVYCGMYAWSTKAIMATAHADLNGVYKGIQNVNSTAGQASVYGSHWADIFVGTNYGRVVLQFNEPTTETASQFTMTSGTAKFNSSGGLLMTVIGDQCVWEMPYYAQGHTGFVNSALAMAGGTATNYSYEYSIDKNDGAGWSAMTTANYTATTLGTALNALGALNASNGFKLKLKITTITTNTTAITSVRLDTTSTAAAQRAVAYPLETIKVSLPGLDGPARIQIVNLDTSEELYNGFIADYSNTFSVELPYEADFLARVRIMPFELDGSKAGKFIEFEDYVYFKYGGLSRSISVELDRVYLENNINGLETTGITIDDSNLVVNITSQDLTWAEIYAYETYWLSTEEGIRDEGRFITAVDTANYILENFKIKNISLNPIVISGGWAVSNLTGKSIDLFDTTGNTIFSAPDHVVPYATGGSALTTAEHNQLMKTATKGDIWASAALGA